MHWFITLFCDSALHVSGSHTVLHQEGTCTLWQMVIICLDVDCLWPGWSGIPLHPGHREPTFKETTTICYIVQVAS
jgi:hypothetical protein